MYVLFIVVEKNGDVCISILHEPGEDKWGYEKAEERWLPIHTVETILISVISMLADPNDESPANVDAAVSYSVELCVFIIRNACVGNQEYQMAYYPMINDSMDISVIVGLYFLCCCMLSNLARMATKRSENTIALECWHH